MMDFKAMLEEFLSTNDEWHYFIAGGCIGYAIGLTVNLIAMVIVLVMVL